MDVLRPGMIVMGKNVVSGKHRSQGGPSDWYGHLAHQEMAPRQDENPVCLHTGIIAPPSLNRGPGTCWGLHKNIHLSQLTFNPLASPYGPMFKICSQPSHFSPPLLLPQTQLMSSLAWIFATFSIYESCYVCHYHLFHIICFPHSSQNNPFHR